MSQRALKGLFEYKEVNVFLRGIVPTIGFPRKCLLWAKERMAGESKYPLKKMLSFAFEGIIIQYQAVDHDFKTGIFVSIISALLFIVVLMDLIRYQNVDVVIYFLIAICFLLGLNLVALGVVGQYVGKNYTETKARPRYIVEEIID